MSHPVRHFTELKVYRAAFESQQMVFTLSKTFPREERYALIDQVRRSSRAVGANIAEAWQKRRYEVHFVSKLSDADAELAETEHGLRTAAACGYASDERFGELRARSRDVGRMLGAMMQMPIRGVRPRNRLKPSPPTVFCIYCQLNSCP